VKIVFLKSAELDLKEQKSYLVRHFGNDTWLASYNKVKEEAVGVIQDFPLGGGMPEALECLSFSRYRQVISVMSRIIYEIRQETIYIHIVYDTRRDMNMLLTKRLLRVD
jgi:toxin ParE1/3/4